MVKFETYTLVDEGYTEYVVYIEDIRTLKPLQFGQAPSEEEAVRRAISYIISL
jgi:hypothetical protein